MPWLNPDSYPVPIVKKHDILFKGTDNACQMLYTSTEDLFNYNQGLEDAYTNQVKVKQNKRYFGV